MSKPCFAIRIVIDGALRSIRTTAEGLREFGIIARRSLHTDHRRIMRKKVRRLAARR